ncbi:DMP19 family protein [Kineococcus esterisolvens]|uniref:DMP19 family protein n=1 Tax=unclassified Kineococcus TaxID=2621656 RepID=UPI003D7DF50C
MSDPVGSSMGSVFGSPVSDERFEAIWNRACQPQLTTAPDYDGDAALHLVLTFHGMVMNAGLLGTLDAYDDELNYPLPWVLQAYRALALPITAALIEQAQREHQQLVAELTVLPEQQAAARWDEAEARIDATYTIDDAALARAARSLINEAPHTFAPLP